MSENDSKKLSELRVVDLKAELEKRGLDKNGVKKDLVERLQKALQNEGNDPETYVFDITDRKPFKRLSTSSSHQSDELIICEKLDLESISSDKKDTTVDTSLTESDKLDSIDEEQADKQTDDDKNNQFEAINLTLEDEEIINDDNSVQLTEASQKSVQDNDEKTTPIDTAQDDDEPKDSSSISTQKKKTDTHTVSTSSAGPSDTDNSQKKVASSPRLLWITNVPKNTRANELKQLLSTCGKVVCAKVVVNARFPGSCCFGYITMGSVEDAENVIEKLNNTEFNGQIIKIDKFENIKADNLNPAKKGKKEENKTTITTTQTEKKDDKSKKSTEESKDKNQDIRKSEELKEKNNVSANENPQRRKSGTSDRSYRERRQTLSRDRIRERPPFRRSNSRGRPRGNVLTFDKIKGERERQRMRDRERALREDNRRRHEEAIRLREMREITKRQRSEAERLEREREKLKQERDLIEREKTELMKLERECQKMEREKLEMERLEFQRIRQRLEEDRRNVKRSAPVPYRREEQFESQERKRPSERHFEGGSSSHSSRFEPPSHSHEPPAKKFSSSKEAFKRIPYEKPDSFPPDKRGRDYNNSERSHQNPVNRYGSGIKHDRPYENPRPRVSREGPSRESQSNVPVRNKDSRYGERERSPHFRSMPARDRDIIQAKSERDHHYSQTNVADRWRHESTSSTPQSKPFVTSSQKSWNAKGSWRPEPPTIDRWNTRTSSSGRSSMNQQYSNNSHISPTCPPPPEISNYSDRFDYNKSSSMRKY